MKLFKVITLFLVGFFAFTQNTNAQSKKYFFSIADDKHFAEEFNYAYSKNNLEENIKRDSIDDYLELYINFRLKVKEAKELGYDTTTTFKKEFEQYKSQLEDSYLNPKKEKEALVREAYDRSLWEIRASHILIRIAEEANPSDTLVALKKVTEIRSRAINGEDFSELAKIKSDDPSAKQNGGDLGYFSVFQMVYPFESAAYNTAVGEISNPIRTQFGYHIIKVIDKRANDGKVQVAHIMIRSTSKNGEEVQIAAKKKAYEIDSLLKNGGEWDVLCKKYSEDQNSIAQNGVLKPFERGQIVPEFEQEAFKLTEANEISEPIKTQFGWHIIKLIKKIPVGSYEEEKASLARKLKSDSRSSMPRNEMLQTLKDENDFYKNTKLEAKLVQLPPSVIIKGKWHFDSLQLVESTILFSVGKTSVSQSVFLHSLNGKEFRSGISVKDAMNKALMEFEDSLIIRYEKSQLPIKYPEYSYLENEYYDGILLFSIMEDSVWNRSMKDSVGLISYYSNNKDHYVRMQKDTTLFKSNLKSTLDTISRNSPLALNISEWDVLNSKLLEEYNVSPLTLYVIPKGGKEWDKAISSSNGNTVPFESEGHWYWVRYGEVMNHTPLNEIKGRVISDYQSFLDKNWIMELRKKYSVKVSKKQLNKVYAHFEAID